MHNIEKMYNIKIPHENELLSPFHINAFSLNKKFDDLHHLLSCTKKTINKTRIIEH